MEKVNHWSEANTSALITGISGIAGSIINRKNQGANLSTAEQQLAALAQQTANALGQANQQGQTQPNTTSSTLQGMTIPLFLIIGIGAIAMAFVFSRKK